MRKLTFRIRADHGHFRVLARRYAAERTALPVLAPYPTLDALVSALSGSERADQLTRCHVLAALVARIQSGASVPLWSAVVLDAFRGMLGRVSRELKGVEPDEASPLVAACFFEALRRVRPERDPDRFAMYVRQETRRLAFRKLRRAENDAWPVPEEDDGSWFDGPPEVDVEHIPDPRAYPPPTPKVARRALKACGIGNAELLAAHSLRGGLRRLAKYLFPHDARQREAVYRVLLRRARSIANAGVVTGAGPSTGEA
jgi:hypothetical protein